MTPDILSGSRRGLDQRPRRVGLCRFDDGRFAMTDSSWRGPLGSQIEHTIWAYGSLFVVIAFYAFALR